MTRLLSVSDFSRHHTTFTESSLRWLIFNGNKNGLDQSGAIVRVGRKVAINEAKFIAWVESCSTTAAMQKAA